jgi:catechol 2,3-dioxygenase-like lactoylglutathione lyase family enzyme
MSQPVVPPNTLCQVGLVVKDIEASARAWSAIFGLPVPNVIITDEYDKAHTNYRGQPSFARAKLAFFQFGSMSIELIEPIGEPSTWKEALDAQGESVHHIAFMVENTPAVVKGLAEHGAPMVQQGHYTGGMYTYIDSKASLGVVLELLENFK